MLMRKLAIIVLESVVGHSDMAVSLTYLRGLEIKAISVDEMPNLF